MFLSLSHILYTFQNCGQTDGHYDNTLLPKFGRGVKMYVIQCDAGIWQQWGVFGMYSFFPFANKWTCKWIIIAIKYHNVVSKWSWNVLTCILLLKTIVCAHFQIPLKIVFRRGHLFNFIYNKKNSKYIMIWKSELI